MRPLLIYLIAMAGAHIIDYRNRRKRKYHEFTNASPLPAVGENDVVLKGADIEISDAEIQKILLRRMHYFISLNETCRIRFISRLRDFICSKTFVIKNHKGFKEMPVLVSAAATQLTFGTKDHILPFFKYIRIYPEEYISDHALKILAGNVYGNTITVAWNHLLDGLEDPHDGVNLGLHEMSHALYFQKMVIDENYAPAFSRKYSTVIEKCTEAHLEEASGVKNVYSDYALHNLQEFWAESVELFFEKPQMLHVHYPEVFLAMKLLLNQNPLHPYSPLVEHQIGFEQRFKRTADLLLLRLQKGGIGLMDSAAT